jgi:allantoate deiminase
VIATKAREVLDCCRHLAQCSEEPGHTTRTFLSPPMREVHTHLGGWMQRCGMTVSVDDAGNLRGLYHGAPPHARRLFIGSHLDTVTHAGAFDGVLGVVLAVALVDLLERTPLPFDIEVLGFSEEEGVRFGVPFIGSRALAGTADEDFLRRCDMNGCSIGDAIRSFGLDPSGIARAQANANAIGYLEFHIEQGPVLEQLGSPLGVVGAIVGQSRLTITFTGAAGHAGTTPMNARRDALAGAAEWITRVEQLARGTNGLVATVGRIHAAPGASNVIPGSCEVSLDVRHATDDTRTAAVAAALDQARAIASMRGLDARWITHLDQPSVAMDAQLVERLQRVVAAQGFPVHRLDSGAGHDAMVMAARMPAAMLFLRSPGGVSHHPDETVLEADIAAALTVGRALLHEMARSGV